MTKQTYKIGDKVILKGTYSYNNPKNPIQEFKTFTNRYVGFKKGDIVKITTINTAKDKLYWFNNIGWGAFKEQDFEHYKTQIQQLQEGTQ